MQIFSKNIIDNYLDDEFGANAKNKQFFHQNVNIKSFHLSWSNLPKNTKDICIVFDDYDAVGAGGFIWIHWLVLNINPEWTCLNENASWDLRNELIQGINSWGAPLLGKDQLTNFYFYGGCAPPDKDHTYRITAYALDQKMELKNGFKYNELMHAIKNHVLDSCILEFKYKMVKE